MKKSILLMGIVASTMLLLQRHGYAQNLVVDARDELQISVSVQAPIGSKNADAKPTLFPNMKPGIGYDVRYTTKLFSRLRIGAWVNYASFNDWSHSTASDYKDAKIKFSSFGPTIVYRLPLPFEKHNNVFRVDVCLSPGLTNLDVNTTRESSINLDSSTPPLTVEATRFTMGIDAHFSYLKNRTYGFSLAVGYQHVNAESKVFPDSYYGAWSMRAGFLFRIKQDKQFKYSTL
ncbi:hypothetical protein [Pseudochryseolinea flava]|uniref:Outer membrane protein beta-barrel domain-containing protein n=1 Tax=Pseudochryseolinea flava TaxID=2059302 RepID=A0A364Y176_9BACT|nr:hypothetical protein [Pseudochryseolinea flava]RAW00368.1 hypothetical protein DQQ10_15050 [Pseudochryseolinea flava]